MKSANSIINKFKKIKEEVDSIESDSDFDNISLSSLSDRIMTRIDRKPPSVQADMYKELLGMILAEMKDMPQGERKILLIMKAFRKEIM
jgi:hypothetical protein